MAITLLAMPWQPANQTSNLSLYNDRFSVTFKQLPWLEQGYGHGNCLNVTENLSLYYTDRSLIWLPWLAQGYGHGN